MTETADQILQSAYAKVTHSPRGPWHPLDTETERPSIQRAMDAVEDALIEGIWTLHRLPDREKRWIYGDTKNGIEYLHDRADLWGAAVEGGRWLTEPPKPPPCTAREVTNMEKSLEWLRALPTDMARLVFWCCMSRRGNIAARVRWGYVRGNLRLGHSRQYLDKRYRQGLREIVAGMM